LIIRQETSPNLKTIDISVPLSSHTPIWPGSSGFKISWPQQLDSGDECNNSRIECDTHIGTHIDAPLHFINNGSSVEEISLDALIGTCSVVYLKNIIAIGAADLSNTKISSKVSRLLIRTDNSEIWKSGNYEFIEDFAHLLPDAARWIVRRGIRLVGIDYLSVGSFDNGVATHKILLEAGVIALEGLNLWGVSPGDYELICLPLNIQGAEGAPVRAVLRTEL